jgi:outer membrane autotransporter protein
MAGSYTTDADGATDHYALLSFGSHMRLGSDAILGIMTTLDTIRQTQDQGAADGTGWLIGPYYVARLNGSALTFEGQALIGQTRDQITEKGWTTQNVAGTRRMINLKASGLIQRPGVDLRPYLRFSAVQQATEAYVTTSGVPVAAVASDYLQGSLGMDFNAQRKLADGNSLNLRGGIGLSLTDDSLQGQSQGLSLRLGMTQTLDEVWTFDAEFTGNADTANAARTVGLSLTWAARF